MHPMPRWRVDILRKEAEHVGVVEAPSAREALLQAVKVFSIPAALQDRVVVEKVSHYTFRTDRSRRPGDASDWGTAG
jgi:hypothetical protein